LSRMTLFHEVSYVFSKALNDILVF
jgi:hypothetical protein